MLWLRRYLIKQLGNIELSVIYFSPSSIELHVLDNSSKIKGVASDYALIPQSEVMLLHSPQTCTLVQRAGGDCGDMHITALCAKATAAWSHCHWSECADCFMYSLLCITSLIPADSGVLQLKICKLFITLWGSLAYGHKEGKFIPLSGWHRRVNVDFHDTQKRNNSRHYQAFGWSIINII